MILVTGATGNNGEELIKLLSNAGIRVRGMARKRPTTQTPMSGVESVTADFDDPASIRRALEGVRTGLPGNELFRARRRTTIEIH